METMSVAGLSLHYEPEDRDAAELIGGACQRTVALLDESWGLEPPQDLHVVVMTSWLTLPFRVAPWPYRILSALYLPLWAPRARAMWHAAGGWEQRFGKRHTVGIKPPRLLEQGEPGLGARIFRREENTREKVEHVTCHEVTHAFVARRDLPDWLKEGLSMLAVDRYFRRPTVRSETLEVLARASGGPGKREMSIDDPDAVVYLYVQGYWLTRYLEETQPGLLKRLLAEPCESCEWDRRVAQACGQAPQAFWEEIDGVVAAHFGAEDSG
jgi:hypothetical protein